MEPVVVGSIVQIDPEKMGGWGGCLVVVSEVKTWGIQGYVQIPSNTPEKTGQAYIRVKTEDFVVCGMAEWTVE